MLRRLGPAATTQTPTDCWAAPYQLESMDGQDNICNAWAALKLVRMAIEPTCPAGVLPSEEAVLLLYGPEPVHEGECSLAPFKRCKKPASRSQRAIFKPRRLQYLRVP